MSASRVCVCVGGGGGGGGVGVGVCLLSPFRKAFDLVHRDIFS